MKKIVIILCLLTIILINETSSEEIVIPNSAIRIRIIANSNEIKDQEIKSKVRKTLQDEIAILLKDTKTVEEARKILSDNMPEFNITVKKVLKRNDYEKDFHINYGLNYFPQKEFKGITYDEGYYESIVVTIGKGNGDNWWCVLFPPLCLMEEEEKTIEKVEYKSFIKEIIEKFI